MKTLHFVVILWMLACGLRLWAVDYDVGPGQPLAKVGAVPWGTLKPGDLVRIHWRPEPYREKWILCRRGTEKAPIVVCGVPGPKGQLPVIDAAGAVTAPGLEFWGEARGLLKIGGARRPAELSPAHIVIESLDLCGAHESAQFTGSDGKVQNYARNAAALYVENVEDLVIRHCTLRDSGNGLMIGPCKGITRNIRVESCAIRGNGNVGSIYEHNSYTEAEGVVFEGNFFGPLRAGASGNNLKDRSAGTVVRYNWIQGGNRQLDLVDSEFFCGKAGYAETWVYGNILVEPGDDGNSQICHYGGDSGQTNAYRKGTLHFFHNTVVSRRSGNTTLFRLSSDGESVDCRNNIVYTRKLGKTLALLCGEGRVALKNNWFKQDYKLSHEKSCGPIEDLGGMVMGEEPRFKGGGTNDDFRLKVDSLCVGHACESPAPVLFQYAREQRIEPRASCADLGALSR